MLLRPQPGSTFWASSKPRNGYSCILFYISLLDDFGSEESLHKVSCFRSILYVCLDEPFQAFSQHGPSGKNHHIGAWLVSYLHQLLLTIPEKLHTPSFLIRIQKSPQRMQQNRKNIPPATCRRCGGLLENHNPFLCCIGFLVTALHSPRQMPEKPSTLAM